MFLKIWITEWVSLLHSENKEKQILQSEVFCSDVANGIPIEIKCFSLE